MILSVVVHRGAYNYICEPWLAGFLCGHCQTPLPRHPPKIRDKCHECGAMVIEVNQDESGAAGSMVAPHKESE